jgi:DNA polymerase III subunit beta
MKVTILTSNLQGKLSFINHAVSLKSQLPVLSNILLETINAKTIKISSTDLEIGIEIFIPATVEEEGGTTVPSKTFTELIGSLTEDTITLQTVNNSLEVISKRTRSVFQTIAKEDFPKLYEVQGEKIATFVADDIHKDLTSVVFAASTDTTRPALSGVLVKREDQGFLLVSTDGYRLSLKHYKLSGSGGNTTLIIPSRVFKELLAIKEKEQTIEMYVAEGNNQVLFVQGETVLVGRLIEAEFPRYEKIIPSDFSVSVSFDREEMQKAVKICSIFARDSANIIKLSLKSDKIVVSSQSTSLGENTVAVEAKLSGEENEIAFNARYLVDVFANLDEKDIVFEMTGPLNPGVFKVQGDNSFLHLIMPIRVQE